MLDKEVFTTGEVAKICNVTIRTVIKWFESGDLEGYKIPGSKDRRIPRDNLVQFMQRHGLPLKGLSATPIRGTRKRVLIADDDRGLTGILLQDFEELQEFELRVAHSGYEAGMVTVDFQPDVILLDYNLGDITGVDVIRLVRENPAVKHVRVIVMSGLIKGSKKIKEILAAGADDFIAKPFDFEELKDKVVQALATR